MQNNKTEKMKHMSFVLPKEERDSFRFLCCLWEISPSEAMRAMVRIAIGGGYKQDEIKSGGKR